MTFDKENYEIKFALVSLTIDLRVIEYDLGKNFDEKQVSVVKGKTVIIQIELSDPTQGNIPITDAKVVLEIGNEELEFEEVDDGVYELEFDTEDYEAFYTSNTITGTIKVSKEDYDTEEIDITIVITIEEIYPGVPTFYFIMIIGAIAAIAGSLATYKYIQIARIPTFVKRVRKAKKAIKSNRDIEGTIIYPSKEEYMVKRLDDKYQLLGLSMEDVLGIKGKKGQLLSSKTDSMNKKGV